MTSRDHQSARLHRSFRDISDVVGNAVEQPSILFQMGWKDLIGWGELLQSWRVLIVSEAGAGKTHECRAEQAARWAAGEPAFYFELAELSRNNPCDLLDAEEQVRFDAWLTSQSDIATVFLDSIDELKLTHGSFETALKRLGKAIAGQIGRVRIVVTTRPIPFDRALIEKHLPIPTQGEVVASDEAFADIAMNRSRNQTKTADDQPGWRHVALMPLSNDQIRDMAAIQGVTDADALLKDVHKRNAEDFARRPQDLIELCVDWRDHRQSPMRKSCAGKSHVSCGIPQTKPTRWTRRVQPPMRRKPTSDCAPRLQSNRQSLNLSSGINGRGVTCATPSKINSRLNTWRRMLVDLGACLSQSTTVADGSILILVRTLMQPGLNQCFRQRLRGLLLKWEASCESRHECLI